MNDENKPTAFLAYASGVPALEETIEDAVDRLNKGNTVAILSWNKLQIGGRILIASLVSINWSKSNHAWDNICIVANSVVSNRQARLATQAYVKRHLGVTLTSAEGRSLPERAVVEMPKPA